MTIGTKARAVFISVGAGPNYRFVTAAQARRYAAQLEDAAAQADEWRADKDGGDPRPAKKGPPPEDEQAPEIISRFSDR